MPEGSFEVLLKTAELVGALMDSEATVVIKDISVTARSILPIHDHMGPNIISDSFINSKRVEGSWFLICYVHSARLELV